MQPSASDAPITADPSTGPAMDRRVRVELVDLFFAGSRVQVATTYAGPLLVGWLFFPLLGWWQTVLPGAVIMVLQFERNAFIRRFEQARHQPGFQPEDWVVRAQWRAALIGTCISLWVLAVTLTRDAEGIFYSAALVVVLAAASLQYSVFPRAVAFYLTPLLLGCCLQQLWLGPANWVLAFFLFITWATLIASSRRFGRTIRNNIELRLLNEQLNRELQEQKSAVEEASAAKTRFLIAASHDLRQPVQSIILLSEALQTDSDNTGTRHLLDKLRTGVDHFANAVDEIMDIAQLDAGNVLVQPQAVLVSDLLDRLDSTYREVAETKQLGFFVRPPARRDMAVWVDPALVWRILSNLVSNAIRYTPSGNVMVAVRRDSNTESPEGAAIPVLRFEVRDSGVGIEPDLQQRVFEEFYQIENLHRDRKEGVGLGLAVARRLTRLMGLRLTMRSQLGQGSVFALSVPVSQQPAASAIMQQGDLPLRHGLCVLVVDDDTDSREAAMALLTSWGVQVFGAGGAEEAGVRTREMLAQGASPNGLLTDHWLPGGSSSSDVDARVRQALREACPGRENALGTAVFTGDSRAETREAIETRGWIFWQKPVRPPQLRQWLIRLTQKANTDPLERPCNTDPPLS